MNLAQYTVTFTVNDLLELSNDDADQALADAEQAMEFAATEALRKALKDSPVLFALHPVE